MKCTKCQTENNPDSKYCENCGALLIELTRKKLKTKKNILVIIVALVTFVIGMTVYFNMQTLNEKQFNEIIAKGDSFLEQKDYKQAEDFYLKSIKIDNKKADPYINLAEIYATQNKKDKAEEILTKAIDNITSKSEIEKITAKKEEISMVNNYYWIIDPVIEVDDIFYKSSNTVPLEESLNTQAQPFVYSYAIAKKGERYGFLNQNGFVSGGLNYTNISANISAVDNHRYYTTFKLKTNSKELLYNGFCILNDTDLYCNSPDGGDVAPQNLYYYFDSSLHFTFENTNYKDTFLNLNDKAAFPLKKSEKLFETEENSSIYPRTFISSLSDKYAIYCKDKLVTDFIYEECGPSSEGLLAAKKDGKWGYVNQEGKTVIPFAYDSSWKQYENPISEKTIPYAYPASEGYVNLVSDNKWELRDITGKLIISQNEFEEITPVYNKTCWVKKGGKWGLITLSKDIKKTENPTVSSEQAEQKVEVTNKTYKEIYSPLIQKVKYDYSEYNYYFLYDIDKDNIKELILQTGTCEADYEYEIYTIKDYTSVFLGKIPGTHTWFYLSENNDKSNYILKVSGHMDNEEIFKINIENGKVVSEKESSHERGYNEDYTQFSNEVPNACVSDLSLLEK